MSKTSPKRTEITPRQLAERQFVNRTAQPLPADPALRDQIYREYLRHALPWANVIVVKQGGKC